jgi:hypothetical protein
MQAIDSLKNQGYNLSVDHDDLFIKYTGPGHPDPATVRPLLDDLRAHKQEAISFLRERDTLLLTLAGADPGEIAKAKEQLRRQGYFLMHSQALGKHIAVIEHDRCRQNVPPGTPTYTFHEIRLLQQGVEAGHIVSIADLRLLHTAKRMGVIVK